MVKVPDHQVAGHKADNGRLGPLVDDSGRFYKPLQGDERGANEVSFYTSFSSNTKIPDHITRFFPKFDGTQLVKASDGSGMQPHLVLQDLTFDRVNLSIMDIKIGSRTWPPHAPEDYVQKCLKKDRATSSLPLGFRVSGVRIFESSKVGYWEPKNKSSIQTLSADEGKLLLKNFISSNASEETQMKLDCAFASTVYGGSTVVMMFEKELASCGKSPRAEIKFVDFAHVHEGKGVIDHNFLGGLCSFIKFISEILTTPDDCAVDSLVDDAQRNHIYSDNGSF
ncbi:inositol polyphosphate multikinase [Salvia divinorum]|uniref:Inositol polyphosphate multikinase n=1 Tax=Salvia divinorum TaxID=28513 RepID=A0ABD1FNM3_SALDI